MRTINERVRWCRENLNFSRAYVANYLGIGRGSYAQKELGKRRFTVDEIAKLSRLFWVKTDMLIFGSPTWWFIDNSDKSLEEWWRERVKNENTKIY